MTMKSIEIVISDLVANGQHQMSDGRDSDWDGNTATAAYVIDATIELIQVIECPTISQS